MGNEIDLIRSRIVIQAEGLREFIENVRDDALPAATTLDESLKDISDLNFDFSGFGELAPSSEAVAGLAERFAESFDVLRDGIITPEEERRTRSILDEIIEKSQEIVSNTSEGVAIGLDEVANIIDDLGQTVVDVEVNPVVNDVDAFNREPAELESGPILDAINRQGGPIADIFQSNFDDAVDGLDSESFERVADFFTEGTSNALGNLVKDLGTDAGASAGASFVGEFGAVLTGSLSKIGPALFAGLYANAAVAVIDQVQQEVEARNRLKRNELDVVIEQGGVNPARFLELDTRRDLRGLGFEDEITQSLPAISAIESFNTEDNVGIDRISESIAALTAGSEESRQQFSDVANLVASVVDDEQNFTLSDFVEQLDGLNRDFLDQLAEANNLDADDLRARAAVDDNRGLVQDFGENEREFLDSFGNIATGSEEAAERIRLARQFGEGLSITQPFSSGVDDEGNSIPVGAATAFFRDTSRVFSGGIDELGKLLSPTLKAIQELLEREGRPPAERPLAPTGRNQ